MNSEIIKTESEYESTQERIDTLMEAIPGTPEGGELEFLVTLVERNEDEVYLIDPPDPATAFKFSMEQQG